MKRLDFGTIKGLHEQAKASGSSLGQMDLASFSDYMQQGDPERDWSAGHSPDNWIGATSRGIDTALEATALPWGFGQIGGGIGAAVDELTGQPKPRFETIGQEVGQGLPRMGVDMGLTIGGMAAFPLNPVVGTAMIGTGAASSFAKGYESSGGSVGSGALAAGMNLVAPGVSNVGAKLGSKLVPASLKFSPWAQVVGQEVGQQTAFAGLQAGQMALEGQDPFTADNLFANALGLAAFSPLSIKQGIKVHGETRLKAAHAKRATRRMLNRVNESEALLGLPAPQEFEVGDYGPKMPEVQMSEQGFLRYLFGDPMARVPDEFKDPTLVNMLRQAGVLNPEQLLQVQQVDLLRSAQRAKRNVSELGKLEDQPDVVPGKEQFFKTKAKAELHRATRFSQDATVEQTADGRWRVAEPDDASARLAWQQRVRQVALEAQAVLNKPVEGIVDSIQVMQTFNKVRTEMNRMEELGIGMYDETKVPLLEQQQREALGSEQTVVPGKRREPAYLRQQRQRAEEEARFGLKPGGEINPVTPRQLGGQKARWKVEEQQAQQQRADTRTARRQDREQRAKLGEEQQVAKGKVRDLGAEINRPAQSKVTESDLDKKAREAGFDTIAYHGTDVPNIRIWNEHAPDWSEAHFGGHAAAKEILVKKGQSIRQFPHLLEPEFGAKKPTMYKVRLKGPFAEGVEDPGPGWTDMTVLPDLVKAGHMTQSELDAYVRKMQKQAEADGLLGPDGYPTKPTKENPYAHLEFLNEYPQYFPKFLKQKGFTGIKYKNLFEGNLDEPSYLMFDPATSGNIKLADDTGVPIAQRFDPTTPDINYSLRRNPLADSEVFRFAKGNLEHNGSQFTRIGKSDVSQEGYMHESRFLKETQMPKQVFDLVKQVYPEAWDGQNVNVNKLRELEKTRPLLEAHVYGQEGTNKVKAEKDQMHHEWYDRLSREQQKLVDDYVYSQDENAALNLGNGQEALDQLLVQGVDRGKIAKWTKLNVATKHGDFRGPKATSYYNQISPFDTTQYPVTRIDVTVPISNTKTQTAGEFVGRAKPPGMRDADYNQQRPLWRQDDLHENLPNTLGWAMVQFVPDPRTGETVMFVAEQQSRWGQDKQTALRNIKKAGESRPYRIDHPLLDLQHKLVLKAAMDEARKRGVRKIVVSDGETAMMTERHDSNENVTKLEVVIKQPDPDQYEEFKNAAPYLRTTGFGTDRYVVSDFRTVEEARAFAKKYQGEFIADVSQAGGMRQHYDQVLPSAAERLTGQKGVPVDMGVHKNALEDTTQDSLTGARHSYPDRASAERHVAQFGGTIKEGAFGYIVEGSKVIKGSPIFHNPDGTPKTTATGKMYDIPYDESAARYSLRQIPDGTDVNGFVTPKSVSQELNRLEGLDPDLSTAHQRLINKIKTSASRTLDQLLGRAPAEIEPGLRIMNEAFDRLGLDQSLKATFMASTQRLLTAMHRDGIKYDTTVNALVTGNYQPREGQMRFLQETAGAFFPETNTATVNLMQTHSYLKGAEGAWELQKTLAHEVSHAMFKMLRDGQHAGIDQFRVQRLQRALEFANELTPQQRAQFLNDAYEFAIPKDMRKNFDPNIAHFTGTAEEFVVEYGAMLAQARANGEQVRGFLRYVPEPIRKFVQTMFRGIDEMRTVLFGAAERHAPELVNDLKRFHNDLEVIYAKDPVIEGAKTTIARAIELPAAIERGDIGGNQVQFSKTGIKALDDQMAELNKFRRGNSFTMSVFQHAQTSFSQFYKEVLPEYGRTIAALLRMDGQAVRYQHQMRKEFMVAVDGGLMKELASVKDRKLTPAEMKKKSSLLRVQDSQPMRKALDKAMPLTNELTAIAGKTTGRYPDFDHPEIQAVMKDFKPEEVADMRLVYEAHLKANEVAASLQIRSEQNRLQYMAADYMYGAGIPHDKAFEVGTLVLDKVMSGKLHELPPDLLHHEGTVAIEKHWKRAAPAYYEFVEHFSRPYFTEFRTGRYGFSYEQQVLVQKGRPAPRDIELPGGNVVKQGDLMPQDMTVAVTGYRSTNSSGQRKAIWRELSQDESISNIKPVDHKNDPKTTFGQMQIRGLDEAAMLVRAHYEAALENMKPDMAEAFKAELSENGGMFDPAQPLVRESNARAQFLAPRKMAPGREKIDMIAAQEAYSSLLARKLANTQTRLETNWLFKARNWDKNPNLYREVNDFRNQILNAGAQGFQNFRKMTTFITMGANVSSALVDATQPITMGLWRATAEVGLKDAFKFTMEGFREAFRPIEQLKDLGFKEILIRASNQGLLKTGGSLDNFLSADDSVNYNVIKAQSNRDLADVRDHLTKPELMVHMAFEQLGALTDRGMSLSMTPMRLSAQINNKNSLWVGYRMGQKKGLTGDALFDYAVNVMQTINLQGQRAAHSSFKLKAGQGNELVAAASLLTNYPLAVFAQLHSNWLGMAKDVGLSPEARARSAQAFAGQIFTQMMFAGVSGLGLSGLAAMVKEVFGYDPEQLVRDGLKHIDESGTTAEILLNGVVNQITGLDVASRYDLSGVGGFNPYTGFDAKGLFGAGAGTFTALYNAPQQIANGDISKINLIPTGFRRMITAWGDDAYTDATGQKIIDPTGGERFAMMVGFKPARFAEIMDQKRALEHVERQVSDDNTEERRAMFDAMQKGDQETVLNTAQARVLKRMEAPEFVNLRPYEMRDVQKKLMREELMGVINYGLEKSLPFDAMADGGGVTGMAKTEAAQGFGKFLNTPANEFETVRTKYELMERLGIKPTKRRPKAIRDAMMVDALRRENPGMTTTQARAIVESKR